MMPFGLSVRCRIKSSVQPMMRPSRHVGSQLVTPSTVPSASIAYRMRTRGSCSSSTPPSVNFISGSALSCAHCSEISSICSRMSFGASLKVDITSLMPERFALLMAVRMSCHFLPVVFHCRGSTTISLPTSSEYQPMAASWSRCSRCTLYSTGDHDCCMLNRANSRRSDDHSPRSPNGPVVVSAMPWITRYAMADRPVAENQ